MSTRAVAVLAVLAAFAPKMPEQCDRMLGKTSAATASAEPSPPPPPPSAPVTAPPIWTPPELPASAPRADGGPTEPSLAAQVAFAKKDWRKVRSLLDKKHKAGKATVEELQMLYVACDKLKDGACLASLRKAGIAAE
jgi:hypothetical protein